MRTPGRRRTPLPPCTPRTARDRNAQAVAVATPCCPARSRRSAALPSCAAPAIPGPLYLISCEHRCAQVFPLEQDRGSKRRRTGQASNMLGKPFGLGQRRGAADIVFVKTAEHGLKRRVGGWRGGIAPTTRQGPPPAFPDIAAAKGPKRPSRGAIGGCCSARRWHRRSVRPRSGTAPACTRSHIAQIENASEIAKSRIPPIAVHRVLEYPNCRRRVSAECLYVGVSFERRRASAGNREKESQGSIFAMTCRRRRHTAQRLCVGILIALPMTASRASTRLHTADRQRGADRRNPPRKGRNSRRKERKITP